MQLPFNPPAGTLYGCLDLRAVYTRPDDGGVNVLIPTNWGRRPEWSDLDQCHYIASLDVPWGITYHVMHCSELPQSRQFRDAWVLQGERVVVDIERARELMRWRAEMLTRPKLLPLWMTMQYEQQRRTPHAVRLEAKHDQLMAASRETFESMSLKDMTDWHPSILRDVEVATPQEQYEDRLILRSAPKEIELLQHYRITSPEKAANLEARILMQEK